MGTSLIIPKSDFKQNSISIPLRVTLGAGKSFVLGGQIITNDTDSDKTHEFASTSALPHSTAASDAITKVVYGVDVNLVFSQFFLQYSKLRRVVFNGKVTSSWSYTFSGCTALEEVRFDSDVVNTSHTIERIFDNCRNIKEIDISKFNTSICDNFNGMVTNCLSLTKIKLGAGFVIPNGATTLSIFNNCNNLSTIDCTLIDSTSTAGSALKTKIEGIISASPSTVKNDLTMYWANNVKRHWNGNTWSNV